MPLTYDRKFRDKVRKFFIESGNKSETARVFRISRPCVLNILNGKEYSRSRPQKRQNVKRGYFDVSKFSNWITGEKWFSKNRAS